MTIAPRTCSRYSTASTRTPISEPGADKRRAPRERDTRPPPAGRLEAVERAPYAGTVWRSVREGSDPLACWRSGGRWDDGTFDVLYTSETRDAAIAERRFHLYQGQPIPPSRIRYELFELAVSLAAAMRFPDLEALAAVGLDTASYGRSSYARRQREYPRSQDIAEACAFLGADGLLVPSARAPAANNVIVFCERGTENAMSVLRNHGIINIG